MNLTVNGEPRSFGELETLRDLLGVLGLDPGTVVVEHNRRIVRRARLGETRVASGDAVEIVHFVGGG